MSPKPGEPRFEVSRDVERDEAEDAVRRADRVLALREEFRRAVQSSGVPARALDVVDHLFASPVVRVTDVARMANVDRRTALSYVDKWVLPGVLEEITGKRRDRPFAANRIIRAME